MASFADVEASCVAEEILCHIRECDRMYKEVHGEVNIEPHCTPCKKLIKLGFNLTSTNLPELCIIHCSRWRLDGASQESF